MEALLKFGNHIDIDRDRDIGTEYLSFNNLSTNDILRYIIMLIINNITYYVIAIVINIIINRNSKININRNINEEYIEKNYYYKQHIERYTNFNEDPLIEFTDVSVLYEKKVVVHEYEFFKTISLLFLWKSKKKRMAYALRHVNFKIYRNEMFVVLGRHGSGKTTLFKLLLGLINNTFGTIRVNDKFNMDIKDIRKEFGICCQTNALYDELTVKEHIKLFIKLKNCKNDIEKILNEVGLEQYSDDPVKILNECQKRKLCIAIALIGNPKYILFDEPTKDLDLLSKRMI